MKERYLHNKLVKFLDTSGFIHKSEVPFLERRIDLVAMKEGKVFAFELKIKDWKKALEQALTCKICTNYSNVCFWYKYLPNDLSVFKHYGIGVYSIKKDVNVILNPENSQIIHKSLIDNLSRNLS